MPDTEPLVPAALTEASEALLADWSEGVSVTSDQLREDLRDIEAEAAERAVRIIADEIERLPLFDDEVATFADAAESMRERAVEIARLISTPAGGDTDA